MVIEGISSPADLRGKSLPELCALADDLRQVILSVALKNGGHLGASLGAVELAIALHASFDSPRDAIVWDVGHQAYAHKLLTGRRDSFSTLRQAGGISGFLSRAESPHDIFGAGHSSTALSAALAIAWAQGRAPQGNGAGPRWTVAIVGDGGLTAGLAFEALNNMSTEGLGPLLIVLNDNQMSISPNVGGLSHVLAQGRSAEFFELLGLDYRGPVDGHDLDALMGAIAGARADYSGRPIVVHALTQKGRGYPPAESAPASYHGVSPMRREPAAAKPAGTSEPKASGAAEPKASSANEAKASASYSEAFGQALCDLAEHDARIVAITAAMPEGTGLTEFARRFPDRFFDVGIAEAHAVTFAAGLATQGLRPVVAIYSTFLQRACDSLIHDVALQKLDVIIAIDRAGLVGADGPTHHGAFDLAMLGAVPGFRLAAPACLGDVRAALAAALTEGGPWAIRYPRGGGPAELAPAGGDAEKVEIANAACPAPLNLRWLQSPSAPSAALIALGASAERAARAARMLPEEVALAVTVRAKPLDAELVAWLCARPELPLLIAEDGAIRGGFGQALAAELGPRAGAIDFAGYADHFIAHGAPAALESTERLSADALAERLRALIAAAAPARSGRK